MGKKSNDDYFNEFERILEAVAKNPHFSEFFSSRDIELMQNAIKTRTKIPSTDSNRLRILAIRFFAQTKKSNKQKPKKPKLKDESKSLDNKLVDKLRAKISKKDKDIRLLTSKIKKLESNHKNEIERIKSAHNNALIEKQSDIDDLTTNISILKNEKSSLNRQLQEAKKITQKNDTSEIQSKYDDLLGEYRTLSREKERLEKEIGEIKHERSNLSESNNQKDKDIEFLQNQVKSLEEVLANPSALLEIYASIVQKNAEINAISAVKNFIEQQQRNDSDKFAGFTREFNDRFTQMNEKIDELEKILNSSPEENDLKDLDPDFSEEDLAIMKNLSILLVQNADYKNNSQGQEKLLSCFSEDSELYTETRKTSQTRNVIENSISGNKFDYIVIHLDRISHSSTKGIPLYQDPRIITIRKGQENPLLIKYSILERFKKQSQLVQV